MRYFAMRGAVVFLAVAGIAAVATAAPYIQVLTISGIPDDIGAVASDAAGNIDLNANYSINRYNNSGSSIGSIATNTPATKAWTGALIISV